MALVQAGDDVTVVTGMPNYPNGHLPPTHRWRGPWREDFGGVKVLRVPLVPRGDAGSLRLAANYISFALSACLVGAFRIPRQVDLIFVFQPSPVTVAVPALLYGALRSAPVVMWVQDIWPDILVGTRAIRSGLALRAAGVVARRLHGRCDRLLVTSESFRERLAQDVPSERIHYLPQWVESFYSPLPDNRPVQYESPFPEGFVVLFAGNLGSAQAFETVLDAASLVQDSNIHWVLMGDGRMRAWIADQIGARNLGSSVHLLDRRPPADMPHYFAMADCLLASLRNSPEFNSTIPAKLQAYLACGRPVVAALEGEGKKIVEEAQCGVVAGSCKPKELADAVQSLARMSPVELAQMGANGRAYYEKHFSRDLLVKRLRWLLSEVVSIKKPEKESIVGLGRSRRNKCDAC